MPVSIVSVYPKRLSAEFPWSPNKGAGLCQYVLEAPPKGGYSILPIERAYQKVYFGENVGNRWDPIEPQSIAENLIHVWAENIVGSGSGAGPGIFIIDHEKPTEKELKAARDRQEQFMSYLFDQADALYRAGKDPGQITQEMRDAAVWLGHMSVEWLKPNAKQEMKKCPFCISDIPAGATVCRVCLKALSPEEEDSSAKPAASRKA
jgi:hypothetical protein